jgi:hypothetical protein
MHTRPSLSWNLGRRPATRRGVGLLAVLALAGALAVLLPRGTSAQGDLTISVVAYVDVAPAANPDCPGCDGNFDIEDQDYAANNPLPVMTFVVLDDTGTEIARQDTAELTVGIQRTVFTVPDGPEFTVNLEVPPDGWQLCPAESPSRTLLAEDFQLGTARETYHFTQGCNIIQETPTPEAPTATPEDGTAVAPTATPRNGGNGGNGGNGKTGPALGTIRGFACIDANANGKVDPTDPGLNDVKVFLHGGGIQRSTISPGTGSFSFDGLGAGSYDVFVEPGPEWRVTTQSRYAVGLSAGQAVLGIDFCMVRVGGAAAAAAAKGIRLPNTGLVDLPAGGLLAAVTVLLGALGALGLSTERRRRSQA